jgi:hypothetical protein
VGASSAGNEPVAPVELVRVTVHGYRNDDVLVSGLPAGDAGRHRRGAEDGARPAGRAARRRAVRATRRSRPRDEHFNLTEWALEHRAVVLFLIIVVAIAGVFSFASSASSRTRTSPCRR